MGLPCRSPSGYKPISCEFAHRRGLEKLCDSQTRHFVEFDLDITQEFHRTFDANTIGVLIGVIFTLVSELRSSTVSS